MNLQWTDERAEQLKLLVELLHEASQINYSSGVIKRLSRLAELADALTTDSITGSKTSFLGFVRQLAIDERMAKKP